MNKGDSSSISMVKALLLLLLASPAHASSAAGTETLVGIVGSDFVLLGADTSVSQSIALTASNIDKIAVIVDPCPVTTERNAGDLHPLKKPWEQQAIAVAAAGDAADADRLLSTLRAHAAIREYESSVGCDIEFVHGENGSWEETKRIMKAPWLPAGVSVEEVACLARQLVSQQLRSPTPYQVCLLVGGMHPSSTRLPMNAMESHDRVFFASEQVQLQVKNVASTLIGSVDPVTVDDNNRLSPSKSPGLQPRLYWLDEYGSVQNVQYAAHGFASNFMLSILDQGYRSNLSRSEAADLLQQCFQQLRERYIINSPQSPCIKCIDAEGCHILR